MQRVCYRSSRKEMNKPIAPNLSGAILLLLGAGTVMAQSSVQAYASIDAPIYRTLKRQGNVQGTLFGMNAATGLSVADSDAAPAASDTRLSPGISRNSFWGFRGTEDLGRGYKAGFALEGNFTTEPQPANSRIFGRRAYVLLATPAGEFQLGRQPALMLDGHLMVTTDKMPSIDMMVRAVQQNGLQTYQDNMVSYRISKGPWLAGASYSPNAGIAGRPDAASSARDKRGRSHGALLSYRSDSLVAVLTHHRNVFEVPFGIRRPSGFLPLFYAQDYRATMLGANYRFARTATIVAGQAHVGRYTFDGNVNPETRTIAFGVKQPLGQFTVGAQYLHTAFSNFTRGKDTGVMLSGDYHLSRRTSLYTRFGYVKDDRGNVVNGLAGGPSALLASIGGMAIPLFAGAGLNIDGRTTIFSLGMRHAF